MAIQLSTAVVGNFDKTQPLTIGELEANLCFTGDEVIKNNDNLTMTRSFLFLVYKKDEGSYDIIATRKTESGKLNAALVSNAAIQDAHLRFDFESVMASVFSDSVLPEDITDEEVEKCNSEVITATNAFFVEVEGVGLWALATIITIPSLVKLSPHEGEEIVILNTSETLEQPEMAESVFFDVFKRTLAIK